MNKVKHKRLISVVTTAVWATSVVTLDHHTPDAAHVDLSYLVFAVALIVLSGGFLAVLVAIHEGDAP